MISSYGLGGYSGNDRVRKHVVGFVGKVVRELEHGLMGRHLLVIDVPHVSAQLFKLYGGEVATEEKLQFEIVYEWAQQHSVEGAEVEATIFVQIPADLKQQYRFHGWLQYMISQSQYNIWGINKKSREDDVDAGMLAVIQSGCDRGDLRQVTVISSDAQNFHKPLVVLAQNGVKVTVLGFMEIAGILPFIAPEGVAFVDIRDPEGFFKKPPRRPLVAFDRIPPEGGYLHQIAPA